MRKVELTMKEQTKYDLVKRFIDNGERNIKRLSSLLNCTLKTAYNLINKYKTSGKEGFVHGNHLHKPTTTKSIELTSKILEIYKDISNGTNVNFTHFNEILKRDYSIDVSYTFLMQLLSNNSFYSPKCHRSTRRKKNELIKEKMKAGRKLTQFEENVVADFLLDSDEAHPRKERSKYFGELLQMDASVDKWFGTTKSYLHAAIDDSTGSIVGVYFDKQETLYGYYQITKQFLTKYGIPTTILTDNRTIFNYIRHGKSSEERDTFTQYGFMCHRIGIDLQTSSIAQVKGRIERLFSTLQSRLITEMHLKKIETMDEANKFVQEYILQFNKQFALPYKDSINCFEKQLENTNVDEYLAIVAHRKVDNGSSIRYNGKYYRFFNDKGDLICPRPKSECLVIKKFDNDLVALFEQTVYHLEELKLYKENSIMEPKKPIVKKVYRPGLDHPWKRKLYENYLKYYRKKLQNNYSYDD